MVKDLLYLDLVGVRDSILYRCALTMSNDRLSRGFKTMMLRSRARYVTLQGWRTDKYPQAAKKMGAPLAPRDLAR